MKCATGRVCLACAPVLVTTAHGERGGATMVDCKICGHPLCSYAGVQRGIVVECSNYMPKPKPQTNADRIRAMSDEELAWELLVWRFDAFAKAKGDEATLPSSQTTILDWLKQPVKDGEGK